MVVNLAFPGRHRVHAVPDRARRRLLRPRDLYGAVLRDARGREPAARPDAGPRIKAQLFRERMTPRTTASACSPRRRLSAAFLLAIPIAFADTRPGAAVPVGAVPERASCSTEHLRRRPTSRSPHEHHTSTSTDGARSVVVARVERDHHDGGDAEVVGQRRRVVRRRPPRRFLGPARAECGRRRARDGAGRGRPGG